MLAVGQKSQILWKRTGTKKSLVKSVQKYIKTNFIIAATTNTKWNALHNATTSMLHWWAIRESEKCVAANVSNCNTCVLIKFFLHSIGFLFVFSFDKCSSNKNFTILLNTHIHTYGLPGQIKAIAFATVLWFASNIACLIFYASAYAFCGMCSVQSNEQ